jgi:SAM-dependent methyltransferase
VSSDRLLHDVARYYADRLARFGTTAAGVDWRDEASQHTRFAQVLNVVEESNGSVADFGCGFGALLPYMRSRGLSGVYRGVDIAPEMITAAVNLYGADPAATFETGTAPSEPADYAVASGIFNVRLAQTDGDWQAYVEDTVAAMDRASRKGFAFNCLTSYSDADRKRTDLYYGDPCALFDLCKRRFSRQVALLHDYGLYEFTVVVRKR